MKKIIGFILLVSLLFSCSKTNNDGISFYHWKAKAVGSDLTKQTLEQTGTSTIYLHYFDVTPKKKRSYWDDGIYPDYVLKEVDPLYKDYDIVPVVFIANDILKDEPNIEKLTSKIAGLIDQISQHHFNTTHSEIQLDCDWNQSTRAAFFQLIESLKERYTVTATIRLHQIKYPEKTGVPPIDKGVLMLYNVGDLKNFEQNSILESSIVSAYVSSQTDYPIELDLALPLFSQTVLKNKENKENKVKLIKGTDRELLESDAHFQKTGPLTFEVVNDTLYNGFYLSNGYQLKLEEVTEQEIIAAYQLIKASQLNISNILFYHLDDPTLQAIDLDKIIEQL